MLLIIVAIVALAVVGLLAYAASKPDDFAYTRSSVIAAPAPVIHAHIDDFHKWKAWSPWEKLDPEMKRSYEGPASGVGAVYGWESGKAGVGRMEIVESDPASKEVIKLDFIKPFPANNLAVFAFTPEGGGTKVTWTMSGKQPFMSKLMGTFFNMDKMIGKDFEAGLASLKALAEAEVK